jgi:hypothetical protein
MPHPNPADRNMQWELGHPSSVIGMLGYHVTWHQGYSGSEVAHTTFSFGDVVCDLWKMLPLPTGLIEPYLATFGRRARGMRN